MRTDEKQVHLRKRTRGALAAALCGILAASGAFPAAAASPEFARTEEEWAVLRDNYLGFEEIPDLINEYNATVQENQEQYRKDEYREKNYSQVRDYLLDLANTYDTMASDAEYYDPEDLASIGRGGALIAANYRSTAESLRESADDNVIDGEIMKLQYDLVERQLAASTRQLFIDYYAACDTRDYAAASLPFTIRSYESAVRRRSVGMATDTEVLEAEAAKLSADARQPQLEAAAVSAKKKLQTVCGWKYESDAEIGPLPVLSEEQLSPDYEAGLEQALSMSLQLMIDRKKLANATDIGSLPLKEKYERVLRDDENALRSAVRSAYDGLRNAVSARNTASANLAVARNEKQAADRAYERGTISALELAGKADALTRAEGSLRAAETSLLKAYYAWIGASEGLSS